MPAPSDRGASWASSELENAAERSRSFGVDAQRYDRFRPGYPDELFDLITHDGDVVLEAGAGTGIATRELAARALGVDAVEPDPAMAEMARSNVEGLSATIHECAFEDFEASDNAYDLVACAQAWHWVDQERGYARAGRALPEGGRLALWWNRPGSPTGATWDAIQAAYERHAPSIAKRPDPAAQRRREETFPAGPGFSPWALHRWFWTRRYDADSYVGYLATHSDHILLPDRQRHELLSAIENAIGDAFLEHPYCTILALAGKQASLDRPDPVTGS